MSSYNAKFMTERKYFGYLLPRVSVNQAVKL